MSRDNLIIIGAGPAGIAAAVEAKEARLGPVRILEKKPHACDTIVSLYHQGKRVDPVYRKVKVEPTGVLSFETQTREAFLERMQEVIAHYDLAIEYREEVQKIVPAQESFHLYTASGLEYEAACVVVAIGIFGKPIKPSYPIPPEVRDKVHFNLPKGHLRDRKVLVVGGGDTAAESACFLARENQVAVSYRRSEFFRLNETNYCNLNDCACQGSVELLMGTDIEGIEPQEEQVLVRFKEQPPRAFDLVFYHLGGMTPQVFLESIGVELDGKRPRLDHFGETNIPRLFLAGDLLVEKGTIMAAFNSGRTVIDRIREKYLVTAG